MSIKNKIKEFVSSSAFPFFLFVLIEGLIFLLVNPNYGDDIFFSTVVGEGESIFNVINHRYSTWTSRSIIELVLISVSSKPKIIWQLIQIFIMWLLAYSISSLLLKKENKKIGNYVICALLLTYPAINYSAAGWQATTINYVWPLALGMFSFISIKKIFNNEKIKIWEYIAYSLAIVFACNMEQMGCIIFMIYLVYSILYFVKSKKVSKFLLIQLLISILSLVFIFTCKGNYIRQQDEMQNYLDYNSITLFDKLSMCFTSTFYDMIHCHAFPILILVLVLPIYIYKNYSEKLYRGVSTIPALLLIPINYFNGTFISFFPYLSDVRDILTTGGVLINAENTDTFQPWLILFITIIFFVSLFTSILLICIDKKDYNIIIIFVIGLISKFMMVFTSTLFASAPRTIMYFEFSTYMITLVLLDNLIKNHKNTFEKLSLSINIFAFYQVINNIFFVLQGLK